jgi:hypothetical protein
LNTTVELAKLIEIDSQEGVPVDDYALQGDEGVRTTRISTFVDDAVRSFADLL